MLAPLALLGLAQAPSTKPAGSRRTINLPVRFIQLAEDDGKVDMWNLKAPLSAATIAGVFEEANRRYLEPIGIHLVFDPARSFAVVRNSNLYLGRDLRQSVDLTNREVKPPQFDDRTVYLPYAESGEPGILFIARRGTGWKWDEATGRWGSSGDNGRGHLRYICPVQYTARHFVHEFGHVLGLPHTYVDVGAKDVPSLQAAIDDYKARFPDRDPVQLMDGDMAFGIKDTCPDPGLDFWHHGYFEDRVRLRLKGDIDTTVYIAKTNIMSSNGGDYLSPDQIEVLRSGAAYWERAGGRLPSNEPPRGCELERATLKSLGVPPGVRLRPARQRDGVGGGDCVEATIPIGQALRFRFQPPGAGRYRVYYIGSRGLDHAACELSLDESSKQSIDFWSAPGVEDSGPQSRLPTGPIYVGELRSAGASTVLQVKVVGRHRMSWGTTVGIEGVILEPIRE